MAWIFQGNPKKFDLDDYLARYPELIYWRVPRYQSEVAIGDRAYIWRAGLESGVVASGNVVEAPVNATEVLHPEALGDDLWFANKPDADEPKVGIALDSVRLSLAEGMLARALVKDDPLLQQGTIITMSNGTVFRLSDAERRRIEELWAGHRVTDPEEFELAASEGRQQVVAHRRRERSRYLVKRKLSEFRRVHGSLYCEVCALPERGRYPEALASSVFEVHHTSPPASAATPCRTTLADLAVVCASCHRAIHATSQVEENMRALMEVLN
jgi:EVE domain